MMQRPTTLLLLLIALLLVSPGSGLAQSDFVTFESGHVRPIVLSPDGSTLFAVNTPDNTLEIFSVQAGGIFHEESVPVGLEPVAVAARNNGEVWVVNHLSDSVSVVDVSTTPAVVTRTLLVGDEPRDIVFAGTTGDRAFISTAHRGQHRTDESLTKPLDPPNAVPGAGDPQLKQEGIGRADVWVFDATTLGAEFGGKPVEILTFFADTPRALAVSPDGNTVYAAAFHSGNQTSVINETVVPDGFGSSGVPGPDDNFNNDPAPEVGVIVKWNGSQWLDADNTNWTSDVNLSLPDHDVFSINANTLAPGSVVEYDHVGTILFNMVTNPVSGTLYVTNTELPNHVLFEGPGVYGGSTVQGHLSESRITVIDPVGATVTPRHLNSHINYSNLHTDVPDIVDPTAKNHSLATPLQPVVSSDGNTIYMAAFGSAKIGVFATSDIENGTLSPATASANYLATTGGGPSGLVLDEANDRIYVITRFNNAVESIDLSTGNSLGVFAMHNPEPVEVVQGRPFLYDAFNTSGNGEASCASCHIFGDNDSLAWNLGNPDDVTSINSQPSASVLPVQTTFHPMKGPMTTQTLRGMATHGGLHWRGDRVDGFFGTDPCTESTGAPCIEEHSFKNFIVAFEGLVGMDGTISGADMQKFTDFALQIASPPNPVRNLDNSLTPSQTAGRAKFFSCGDPGDCAPFGDPNATDTVEDCDGCHNLEPSVGFFGSGGEQSFEGGSAQTQNVKVPHMRNLYAKIGMFGDSAQGNGHLGDQVRGFGYLHDGSIGSVAFFLSAGVFQLDPTEEDNLTDFSHAFPTDFAPIVGQQITLTSTSDTDEMARVTLLRDRSKLNYDSLMAGGNVAECDLIVKGLVGGSPRGWVRETGNFFRDDLNNLIADVSLRALADSEGPLTFTCVPPGSGVRAGINRDRDNLLDGLDNCPGVPNDDQADSNGNGIGDVCESGALPDSDGDGIDDGNDNCPDDVNPLQEDFDGDGLGDACDPDDDDDGLDDAVETGTGNYVDPSNTGTDPLDPDTDGDGYDDGFEVLAGSNPNLAGSVPGPAVPLVQGWGWVLLVGAVLLVAVFGLRRESSGHAA